MASAGLLASIVGTKVRFGLGLTRRGFRRPFRVQKSRHNASIAVSIARWSASRYS